MEQPDNDRRILKDDLGKCETAFQPPQGYFEKLEENISIRISPPEKETTTIWKWQPAWALILSACILSATFRFLQADLSKPENSTNSQNVLLDEEEITTELLIESGMIMELEDHLLCEAVSKSNDREVPETTDQGEMLAICDYLMDNSQYHELTIENNLTQE